MLQVLARGSPLASYERNMLVPLLATFCATLTAVLSTLHDAEFLGHPGKILFEYCPFDSDYVLSPERLITILIKEVEINNINAAMAAY